MLKKGLLAVLGLVVVQPAALGAFIPSTIFELRLTPRVTFDARTWRYAYAYELFNAPGSEQSPKDFGVRFDADDFLRVASPKGWEPDAGFAGEKVFLWYYIGTVRDPIPPGTGKSGFGFQSRYLPTIQTSYTRSSFEYFAKSENEMADITYNDREFILNNSKKVTTIGPGALKVPTDLELIRHMQEMRRQATHHQWIRPGPAAASLATHLSHIERSLEAGQRTAARTSLDAFQQDLEQQRAQAVSEEAYQLLRPLSDHLAHALR